MFEKGSKEDVAAACGLLEEYGAALSSEVQSRDEVLAALQGLIAAQVIYHTLNHIPWCTTIP